jgi:hypothetical protein
MLTVNNRSRNADGGPSSSSSVSFSFNQNHFFYFPGCIHEFFSFKKRKKLMRGRDPSGDFVRSAKWFLLSLADAFNRGCLSINLLNGAFENNASSLRVKD